MVKIILNADDFGRSAERNRAIDDCFKQGLITSAGLIITGKYLQNALSFIDSGDYVEKIHLHVNLSTSLRDEDPEDIPLTEAMRKDSFFCKDGKFKKYKGLPHRLSDIRKWRIVYQEMVAQYEKFKEVTKGKADYKHIDFHLWYNLTWPVSMALRRFTRNIGIESVRYIGMHQVTNRKFKLYWKLSQSPKVTYVPSTNIDFYLSKNNLFLNYDTVELYCHPHYKENVFLDDSPSYLKHNRQPMLKQLQLLNDHGVSKFISWKDI